MIVRSDKFLRDFLHWYRTNLCGLVMADEPAVVGGQAGLRKPA
jgi:hypothetical protein